MAEIVVAVGFFAVFGAIFEAGGVIEKVAAFVTEPPAHFSGEAH